MRSVIARAADFDVAARGVVELATKWTPNALGALIEQILELAALEGREAVFLEADGEEASFADLTTHEFAEQIAFLRQKRGKPTRTWLDARHGDHDRAFTVAGVTDMAMLDAFQDAIIKGAQTHDIKTFAAEFDRLVEEYGWSYNGRRNWRIRTIFETNIRTSYMAGRLTQMRDPEMVKARPYWQYWHGETRVPETPRPHHLKWHKLVLRWDDTWWDIHFPPNDWMCSCGVRTLSERDLARMGKDGPDPTPEITRQLYRHKSTGETVNLPKGVGFGWDYMPGNLWERGLVPSALIEEGNGFLHQGRHVVQIDTPRPLDDLIAAARPFKSEPLSDDLTAEAYVRAFLEPFGADIGSAVRWEDKTGTHIPISDAFFRSRDGGWKIDKRGRARFAPLMAEALLDPDEIWLGVAAKPDPVRPDVPEYLLDRRYIRLDPELGIIAVMEVGRKWWEPVTIYDPSKKNGAPDLRLLDLRRGGKLLWTR